MVTCLHSCLVEFTGTVCSSSLGMPLQVYLTYARALYAFACEALVYKESHCMLHQACSDVLRGQSPQAAQSKLDPLLNGLQAASECHGRLELYAQPI